MSTNIHMNPTPSTPDAHTLFGTQSDSQWLALLKRSIIQKQIDGVDFPGFPADAIQSQFVGSSNAQALDEAFCFYSEFKRQAHAAGTPLDADSVALDFGCGWGRYLRFFWKDVRESGLYGVDIDPDILQVCRSTGVRGQLSRIEPRGRLQFTSSFFSHLIAYSVFTHLPEVVHLHWMREIARVMRPGGIFALTLEPGRFIDFVGGLANQPITSPWHEAMAAYSPRAAALREAFDAGQFVYLPTGGGEHRDTSNYGDSAVPLSFIEKHWGPYFDVIEYIDDPARFWQAVLVVRRK